MANYSSDSPGSLVGLDSELIDDINRLVLYPCWSGSYLDPLCAVGASRQVVNNHWRSGVPSFSFQVDNGQDIQYAGHCQ